MNRQTISAGIRSKVQTWWEESVFKRRITAERGIAVSGGVLRLPSYSDASRPTTNLVAGAMIWNTGDAKANLWDGTQWTLPDGTAT